MQYHVIVSLLFLIYSFSDILENRSRILKLICHSKYKGACVSVSEKDQFIKRIVAKGFEKFLKRHSL